MSWSRGGLTGLICRDNNGAHARPLGSQCRPDGATTQEVYNRPKNVFNHQTSVEEQAAWPELEAVLRMEAKEADCSVSAPQTQSSGPQTS